MEVHCQDDKFLEVITPTSIIVVTVFTPPCPHACQKLKSQVFGDPIPFASSSSHSPKSKPTCNATKEKRTPYYGVCCCWCGNYQDTPSTEMFPRGELLFISMHIWNGMCEYWEVSWWLDLHSNCCNGWSSYNQVLKICLLSCNNGWLASHVHKCAIGEMFPSLWFEWDYALKTN